jgi:urease accessory protein UreE
MRLFPERPAIVVDSLPMQVIAADLTGKERDALSLSWEQRRWMRGRFITKKGREIGIALPTGIRIEPGQVIWIDRAWYLALEAAPEPLLTIEAFDQQQAIRVAFEVGNLHFPLATSGKQLLVPDNPAMTQLLDRLEARWKRCNLPFAPIGRGSPHA